MKPRIRVLVADDSALIAEGLASVLQADGDIEVVGRARHGEQAVEMVERLRPDLVTMDIRMPIMDGLEAIEQIMAFTPTPILVVTGEPTDEALTFEALARGALDLLPKPELVPRGQQSQIALRQKVRLLAAVPVVRHVAGRRRRASSTAGYDVSAGRDVHRIVAICSSTGGPRVLPHLLAPLPASFPLGIVVVQHISEGFCDGFARWLAGEVSLRVRVAVPGARVEPGTVWLAPDRHHMRVEADGRIRLDAGPPVDGHVPSGNVLLESVAIADGRRAIGIVLTGMQADGARGLLAIRQAGGMTLVQDEASSVVFGMPKAAIDIGAAQQVLAPADMAKALALAAGLHRAAPASHPRRPE